MKTLIILIVAFVPHLIFAQGSLKVEFEGGEMYLTSMNAETGEQIFKKPIGRVLGITYDSFYKSYSIIYNYENKGVTVMDFEYLKDGEKGLRFFYEKESLKGKFGVVDFHIFQDDYWSYKDNVKGNLHFIGFDIKEINGQKTIMGLSIENFERK